MLPIRLPTTIKAILASALNAVEIVDMVAVVGGGVGHGTMPVFLSLSGLAVNETFEIEPQYNECINEMRFAYCTASGCSRPWDRKTSKRFRDSREQAGSYLLWKI